MSRILLIRNLNSASLSTSPLPFPHLPARKRLANGARLPQSSFYSTIVEVTGAACSVGIQGHAVAEAPTGVARALLYVQVPS